MKVDTLLADATALVGYAANRPDLSNEERFRLVCDGVFDRLPPEARAAIVIADSPWGRAIASLVSVAVQTAFDKWKAKRKAAKAAKAERDAEEGAAEAAAPDADADAEPKGKAKHKHK